MQPRRCIKKTGLPIGDKATVRDKDEEDEITRKRRLLSGKRHDANQLGRQ